MAEPTVRERVVSIIVEKLGVDPEEVADEARLEDDLGADSLDLAEIGLDLEEEFNLKIPDGTFDKAVRAEQIFAYVEEHKKK